MSADQKVKKIKIIQGVVVSNKMEKSVVVQVNYRKNHPTFKKFVNLSKKIMAHDESNALTIGDVVNLQPVRPISKRKQYQVVEVVKKAASAV